MNRLIWLALLLPVFAIAQTPDLPIDSATHKITYQQVIPVEGVSKDELFSRGREWFAKTYRSAQKVLQMDDKENGKLVGKALIPVTHKALGSDHPSGHINYTITLQAKDGRYRYEITDLYHEKQLGTPQVDLGECEAWLTPKSKGYKKLYDYYLQQADADIKATVASLTKAMTQASTGKKDDW